MTSEVDERVNGANGHVTLEYSGADLRRMELRLGICGLQREI